MLSLYRNLKKFQFKSKLSTYIFAATINNIRTQKKKKLKTSNIMSLDQKMGDNEDAATFSDYIYDEKADTLNEVINNEVSNLLKDGISKLPDENREVFVLREFEKLGYTEISEITGFSIRKLHYLKESADSFMKDYFVERNIELS
jgi:RNA polymerase sigma factor (sigma-70 family)